MSLFTALLFFVLTPGILLSLPKRGSKIMVAATHAVVFALVYHFTHKIVWRFFYEGFANAKAINAADSSTAINSKAARFVEANAPPVNAKVAAIAAANAPSVNAKAAKFAANAGPVTSPKKK